VRLVVGWSLVLAACSFEHGWPGGNSGSGSGSDQLDAPVVVPVDAAPIDMSIDGTPSCPDDDSDGVCNNVDDWPCGAKPTAPGSTMMISGNNGESKMTITMVNLDGTGRLAVATPGESMNLTLRYDIDDTACPSACIDQVEIGWETGVGRIGCVFDDTVSPTSGIAATVNITVHAPATKKVYDLRANLGQNFSCGNTSSWWGGTPDASRTIAKLCVH
jgi:hypothetical protein